MFRQLAFHAGVETRGSAIHCITTCLCARRYLLFPPSEPDGAQRDRAHHRATMSLCHGSRTSAEPGAHTEVQCAWYVHSGPQHCLALASRVLCYKRRSGLSPPHGQTVTRPQEYAPTIGGASGDTIAGELRLIAGPASRRITGSASHLSAFATAFMHFPRRQASKLQRYDTPMLIPLGWRDIMRLELPSLAVLEP